MKFNKKKIAKYALRGGTAVGALMLGLVPAYLLTPARTNIIDLSLKNNNETNAEQSSLSELVNRYKGVLDDGIGLHMEFEDFKVSFPGENNRNNVISIKEDSNIELMVQNLDDIDLKADLTIDYNSREVPLAIAYTDETAYVRLYDLGIKMGSSSLDDLVDLLNDVYGQDLGIDIVGTVKDLGDKFVDKIKELGGSLLSSDDTTKVDDGTGIKFGVLPDEKLNDGGHLFKFEIANTERLADVVDDPNTPNVDESLSTTYMGIHITTKANYDITRIDLCPDGYATDDNNVQHPYAHGLKFGNIMIQGALNVNIGSMVVNPPVETNTFKYVDIVNYYGWLRRLGNLLADGNRKMAFDFAARIQADNEVTDEITQETTNVPVSLGGVKGSINLDASNLINLEPLKAGYDGSYQGLEDGHLAIDNEKIRKVMNAVQLGLDFQLYDADDNWDAPQGSSNLSIKYANESGYITLNEFPTGNENETSSVLKAKVDTKTINWMIEKLPSAIDDISAGVQSIIARFSNRTYVPGDENSSTEGFFDFITSSELVTAIKEGEYAPILDVITRISNNSTVGVINVDLALASLGFGADSAVSLTLDARDGDEITVMSLTASNVRIHSVTLDFTLNSARGREIEIGEESSYDSMTFLPTVVEQVEGILGEENGSKEVAFDLDATIADSENHGMRLYGDAQFNYDNDLEEDYANKGFGQLTIDQYKYTAIGGNNTPWYSHKIALDVDNHSDEPSGNKVKFIYGNPQDDSDNIKGYFTMETIYDVVKTVKTLMKDEDPRYTKFTDMFSGAVVSGSISDIINNKNYLRLAKNDFIKEVKQQDNGHTLNVVIGGSLLGLGSDINVKIGFKDVVSEYGDRELESIELVNLVTGEGEDMKTINLKLTLKDFNVNYASPISSGDAGYYDLTSIKMLLDFGINSTQIDYYHLNAAINLNALSFVNVDLAINVYIHVNGTSVELYGKISYGVNKLVVWGASLADVFLHGNMINVDTEFTFKTFDNNDDKIDGYFDIRKDVTSRFIFKWHDIYHYRTKASNLIGDDIMTYIMDDMLDINGAAIGNLASSGSEQKPAGQYTKMFTDTFNESGVDYFGYSYDENTKSWRIGMNLEALTANESIKYVDVSLNTQEAVVRNETKTVLKDITINKLWIQASILKLTISGSITLQEVNVGWPSNVTTRFNALTSVSDSAFGNKIDNPNAYIQD